jgi:hypothetical protein
MTIKKFYEITSQKADSLEGDEKGGVGHMWAVPMVFIFRWPHTAIALFMKFV